MVEVDGGASFVVASSGDHSLCNLKVSDTLGTIIRFGGEGSESGFSFPVALAMVPCGGSDGSVGLVVLEVGYSRFQVFPGRDRRRHWVCPKAF